MSDSKPRILLLGKNGQVGWELGRSLAPLGQVIALNREGLVLQDASQEHHIEQALCGDMCDLSGLSRTMYALKPDVVVNAAAYTAVDKAESDVAMARRVNTEAPGVLAQAAQEIGALLVHYSTDYVFDGSGNSPWREVDIPHPLNAYGLTKLEGEKRILEAGGKHLILRTSWVFSARGNNFAKTMLRLARQAERLTVVNDQYGAPTGAELIADATAHAIHQVLRTGVGQGTYHLAAAGETTWHGYAQFVIAEALRLNPNGGWNAHAVQAVPTSSFPTPARRPKNSRLATELFQSAFSLHLPPWQQGVGRMLAEIL